MNKQLISIFINSFFCFLIFFAIQFLYSSISFSFSSQISTPSFSNAFSGATANAGHASIDIIEANFSNPSLMPYFRGYFGTTNFVIENSDIGFESKAYSLSIIDNLKETIIPTSFAYWSKTTLFYNYDDYQNSKNFRFSVGDFVNKTTSLGVAANHRIDDWSPAGGLLSETYTQTNLDFAGLIAITKPIGFTFILNNVLPSSARVPEKLRLMPSTTFGLGYMYKKILRLKGDLSSDSNNSFLYPTIAIGFESTFNNWLVIRFGEQYNNEKKAVLSAAGIGFTGPRFNFCYAYQFSKDIFPLTRHAVDLSFPFW